MPTATQTRPATSHFLEISDLDRVRLEGLLGLAEGMKATPLARVNAHRGKTVACCFGKPSPHTPVSFEVAAYRLGMLPVMLRRDELQLGRGEPIADTARVLSAYTAAIVIRTFAQAEAEEVAAAASVPVVNALTDQHHPCQALADLLTLQEGFGRLEGLRLAYVGEGGNVAHSLLQAGALAGMSVAIATPPGYRPDEEIVADAAEVALNEGGSVLVTDDPQEAVRDADAVYTGTWALTGDDAERRALEPYRVDVELMA
jgi:ornithine carbamoyltransferase